MKIKIQLKICGIQQKKVISEKYIELNAYIRKEKSKTNKISYCNRKLGKIEQIKPQIKIKKINNKN